MKKFLIIFLSIIIVGGLIKYTYTVNKGKDIKYTAEKYFTSGFLKSYKMCTVSTVNLSFSNGNVAFVKVEGTEEKSPHKKTAYNVFLEKNDKGIWKVKKIYPVESTLKN